MVYAFDGHIEELGAEVRVCEVSDTGFVRSNGLSILLKADSLTDLLSYNINLVRASKLFAISFDEIRCNGLVELPHLI
jgi:hypothetical protein